MNALEKEKRIAIGVLWFLAVACAIYVGWDMVYSFFRWLFHDTSNSFLGFVNNMDFGHYLKVLTVGAGFYIFSVYLRIKGW